MSDVFGSLVKQYYKKQKVDRADWLIGKGMFTSKINGDAICTMKSPGTVYNDPRVGKDPQPSHMKDYKKYQKITVEFIFIQALQIMHFILLQWTLAGMHGKRRERFGI